MSKITGKVNYKKVLKGDTGYTYKPHVTTDGILYWSNNGDLPNPLPVNIKGKQGEKGEKGEEGDLKETDRLKIDKVINDYDKAIANLTNGNESITNSEIVQARGVFVNLDSRLNNTDKQINDGFKNSLLKFPRLNVEVNDNGRLLRALNGNDSVIFPEGEYIINNLELPNKDIKLIANGSVIIKNTDLNTPCIHFSSENCIEIQGFIFTNTKYAIFLQRQPSLSIKDNFNINNCSFININVEGSYSIYLDGMSQGNISRCNFINSNGIYRVRTINTIIDSCILHTGKYGINDDGDFSAYSCGITISSVQMLGYEYGIILKGCDNFVIANSMIDYNDNPIVIDSVYTGKLHSSYISTRTTNPCIKFISGTHGEGVKEVKIYGNDILANNNNSSLIEFCGNKNIEALSIRDNNLTFFSKYALENNLEEGKSLILSTIDGNYIANRTGYGICAILTGSTDSSTKVVNNNFSLSSDIPILDKKKDIYMLFGDNRGYKSKNNGIAIINPHESTVTINHNIKHYNELRINITTNRFVNTRVINVNERNFTVEMEKSIELETKVFWFAEDIYNI